MICTDAVCSITLNEAPVGFLIPISFKMPDQVEVASVRILEVSPLSRRPLMFLAPLRALDE